MIDSYGCIVSIWKHPDWTSNDIIRYVKPLISPHKVGHAGTLDPFAEVLSLNNTVHYTQVQACLYFHRAFQ